MDYNELKSLLEAASCDEAAVKMSAYMRNQFAFYGIQTQKRREIYKPFIREVKKSSRVDWQLLRLCWGNEHREMQYFVLDYLNAVQERLSYEDIATIKEFIVDKSWWDTIDYLCKIIGTIGLKNKRVKKLMLKWAVDDNMWLRRTAIEHQLGLKGKTDTELLEKIILLNLGSGEFFINKAIGWALREYSKTDADWVKCFINKYKNKMSGLSVREGSKYVMLTD